MSDSFVKQRLPLFFALLCILALIPIWSVAVVPLQDYPAHMARMHILVNLQDLPRLQEIYRVQWDAIPNLAMDIVVPLLSNVFSIFTAGKIFVSIIIIMWIAGPLVLHHALFGNVSFWPLLASFFAYNQCLLIGLLNFNFGAGLLFFVLAAWVYSKNWPSIPRIALFSVLATILYFSHFIAFAIYGLAVVAYEVGRTYQEDGFRQVKRVAAHGSIVLAQFVAPAAILLFLSPTKGKLEPTASIHWGGLWDRLMALRSSLWFDGGAADYLAFLFVGAVFLYPLVRGSLKVHRAFLWSLVLLSLVALLIPMGLDGPGLRHIRIPPVLAAMIFAGTRWTGAPARRAGPLVVALALLLFLGRSAAMVDRWQLQDAQIAEFREAISKIEQGSAIFSVTSGTRGRAYRRAGGDSLLHIVSYATIDRSAFVPSVFADPDLQPIRQVEYYWETYGRAAPLRWDVLPDLARGEVEEPHKLIEWDKKYDYLAVLNVEHLDLPAPDCLSLVHTGSFFTIFEVKKSEPSEACYEP
jgi:hypothetical protein